MPRITKSKPVTLVLDGTPVHVIPSIEALRNIGLTSANIAKYMLNGAPEQDVSETWAYNLGQLMGAGLDRLVGDLINGTSARAEWDLQSHAAGLAEATRLLPADTRVCAMAFCRGVDKVNEMLSTGVEVRA